VNKSRRRKPGPGNLAEDERDGSDLLSTSPFDGDLEADLAAKPPRMKLPGPALYLGAGILAVVGFVGGIQADKLWGGNSGSSAGGAASGAAGRTQGGGFQGRGLQSGTGGTGSTGNMTIGTVQKVVGKTIYLKTTDGKTIKITTDGSTKVKVSKSGSAKDLKSGVSIVVQGSADKNGTVTATTVNEGGGSQGAGSQTGGFPNGGGGAGPVG
jgi:hypothetical protein